MLGNSTQGWPWQAEDYDLPAEMPDGQPWPRITVVTPSYNQGRFLEETIRSVLLQGYPNLEYIVIDGGSTDQSVDIVRKHESHLAYWVSEPDRGQYDAINKGFARSTGEIMAWLNSDDVYCPWALHTVGQIFRSCGEVDWLTTSIPLTWSAEGIPCAARFVDNYTESSFARGRNAQNDGRSRTWIMQEGTFWRRTLWDQSGGQLDASFAYAGDFELWTRFWQHADLVTVPVPLAGFRVHDQQKTARIGAYYAEVDRILTSYAKGRHLPHWSLSLLRRFYEITGRGGRVFGSRVRRVVYRHDRKDWVIRTKYVI